MELGAALTAAVVALLSFAGAVFAALNARDSAREVERLRFELQGVDRLRSAIGPLRLELFLIARSVVRRLPLYHDGRDENHPYRLLAYEPTGGDPNESKAYHDAGLFMFRLLRPLGAGDRIERDIYYTDLELDPTLVDVLRFAHAGVEMLTGEKLQREFGEQMTRLGHRFDMESHWEGGDLDWRDGGSDEKRPFQRIRSSYLRRGAAQVMDKEKPRCLDHSEFLERWENEARWPDFHRELEATKQVLDDFHPDKNPVFWLRLVGYAYVCKRFHDRAREQIHRFESQGKSSHAIRDHKSDDGFQELEMPTREMLSRFGLGDLAADCEQKFDRIYDDAL